MLDRYLQYNPWRARVVLLALMLLVMACAQLGAPTPDTLNEKIAVALTANTTIRTTATQLLSAGKLSADDGANVLATTDAARAGIELARKLGATDMAAANAKLTAATTVLNALQGYLAARSAK